MLIVKCISGYHRQVHRTIPLGLLLLCHRQIVTLQNNTEFLNSSSCQSSVENMLADRLKPTVILEAGLQGEKGKCISQQNVKV